MNIINQNPTQLWDFFIFSTMRKILLPAIILIFSLVLFGCGQSKNISSEAEKTTPAEITISETDISHTLKYLSSDELEGRKTGTEGIEKAAQYIEGIFKKHALKPFFESYRDSFEVKGTTGYNLIGLKEGSDPRLKNEFIIIGAHYDHIGTGKLVGNDSIANGANDNASGTTAVLELAKYFAEKDTKRSIVFTLFSAEEMGLVGAKHLAGRLKKQSLNLYLMYNIEMIGVPMEGKEYQAYLTGYELSNLGEKFNEYSGEKVIGFLPEAKEYNLFKRSDNYPFYEEFQIPAQTISTFDFTNFDYYHQVSDEYELMNVAHMADLIKSIIPGIERMANTATREIKMDQE